MKSYPKELLLIAKRVVWFKSPRETLENKVYFLCYLMQYGLTEDIIRIRKYYSTDDFKDALEKAYPGILDKRSWAYWNLVIFNDPKRKMPKRFSP